MTVYRNRVKLTNGRSGETLDRVPAAPYSFGQKLIADQEEFSGLLKQMVKDLVREPWLLRLVAIPKLHVRLVDQPCEEADAARLQKIVRGIGFMRVTIEPASPLSSG